MFRFGRLRAVAEKGSARVKLHFGAASPVVNNVLPSTCVVSTDNFNQKWTHHVRFCSQQSLARPQTTAGTNSRKLDRVYKRHDYFPDRHLGPRESDIEEMLSFIGAEVKLIMNDEWRYENHWVKVEFKYIFLIGNKFNFLVLWLRWNICSRSFFVLIFLTYY